MVFAVVLVAVIFFDLVIFEADCRDVEPSGSRTPSSFFPDAVTFFTSSSSITDFKGRGDIVHICPKIGQFWDSA